VTSVDSHPAAAVEITSVSKQYGALRPLRIEQLEIGSGQSLALMGLDGTGAEVLVSLITGATLPDSGDVRVLGRHTAEIADAEAWLKWLEHFGLLSERTIVVDQLTVAQNLAMPFSMDVEDMTPAVREQVTTLAAEVGIAATDLDQPAAHVSALVGARIRLARALSLSPRIFLAEHPNAMLSGDDTPAFAADLSRIITRRRLAALIVTADRTFAASVAEQVVTLQPATGALRQADGWRRWFS